MKYVLSLSYGKDSLACLEVIHRLGLPLDEIVHEEMWATETIPADLPEMVKFKEKADHIILERYGMTVKHKCKMLPDGTKDTYEKRFYHIKTKGKFQGEIVGWPTAKGPWCNSLKIEQKDYKDCVNYIGIAADETERIARWRDRKALPLVEAGWSEKDCFKWCSENDLLSPLYKYTTRGGCWFCHVQLVQNLQNLYNRYPEYWSLMLKWDSDSPITYRSNGRTIHDYDKRFEQVKRLGIQDMPYKWKYLEMSDEEIKKEIFLKSEVNTMEMITTTAQALTNKELAKATNRINKLGEFIQKNTYEIAYTIAEVAKTKCFEEDGFKSVHDWTKALFGFAKTASYALLKIGQEYTIAVKASNGKVTGYRSNITAEDEADYTPRQVQALLPAGHELAQELNDTGKVNPTMTVKEIDKAVKLATADDEEDEAEEESSEELPVVSYEYEVTLFQGVPYNGESLGVMDDLALEDKLKSATTVSDPVDCGYGIYKIFAEYLTPTSTEDGKVENRGSLAMYVLRKIEVQA